jgi:MoxR-like ATPase
MEEKQVTIGEDTFSLQDPFMVLATQNPLEQEGTFSLPEAQLDRFLLKTLVEYPSRFEEKQILYQMTEREHQKISKIF